MITYDRLCPDCGGAMMLRRNKQTDELFYGCTFYPDCIGTRPADEDDEVEDAPSDRLARADKDRWRKE